MGFSFLSPLFAIGLVAVAIPILVHLVHRERKETTPFPSLMFLRRTPYQHSRRQRIRDWLLFLLRALAFLLAVLAFARPVLRRAAAAAPELAGGRELVVLLDQSLSMRIGDRWTRAQEGARRAVEGLGAADRATIVLFDDAARAVNEPTADGTALRAAIDSAKPTDAATRYGPALALARRILATTKLPKREVLVVSDLQRSGWDLNDDTRLPSGTVITPVDVGAGDVRDRAVRSVELRRDMATGRERIAVTARISNAGPAVRAISARLEVSGRAVETRTLDVGADAGGLVTFAPVPVPDLPQSATVTLAADDFTADDTYHFILERAPTVPVLLVDGAPATSADRGIFVQRALEIGDNPSFDVLVRRITQLAPNDFNGRRLAVLNDVPYPSGEAGRRLEAFVRAGGGLIVAEGEGIAPRTWPSNGLLPSAIAEPTDRASDKGAVLGFLDRSHPALSLFGAAQSGDLSSSRFFRYRPIAADSGVLARFDDGAPALVERRHGRGRVLAWGSSLDGYWNDLPRQPVFLPFLRELAQYAAGWRSERSVYDVGEPVDVAQAASVTDSAGGAASAPSHVAVSPSGRRLRIGGDGGTPALIPREAGVYEVRRAGNPGERPRLVAVNVPSRELEFARFDPARLTNVVTAGPAEALSAADAGTADVRTREREQSLWWYLLLAVTALLVAESILADRLSTSRPATARS